MPEPVSNRVELSIAAIDELMNLLASVDVVDHLDLPDLPPRGGDEDGGEQPPPAPVGRAEPRGLALQASR